MSWPMGLSTGIAYDIPIESALPVIAESGFRTIEVATASGHLSLSDLIRLERTATRIRSLGLRVLSLHAPFGDHVNFTSPDETRRREAIELLRQGAAALQMLGGTLYVIHPGSEDAHWVWDREPQLARSVDALRALWGECRARGLTLCLETPLPHLLGGQLDDFAWILDRLPGSVTVCLDTSHASLGGHLLEAVARFAPRLAHVQASDNRGHTDDHLVPGDGVIDWPRLLSGLREAGYQGAFMLEVAGGHGPLEKSVARAATLLGGTTAPPPGWPGRRPNGDSWQSFGV